MKCLGIESTAHTFSAGLVSGEGDVLGMSGDMYVPPEGGLHPFKTAQHHAECFTGVLAAALDKAGISIHDVDLVAFSQGPGLGPCLRVGATVARALHLQLQVPIVGVNHCVAHVEIGRLACNVDDPLTLYVSGGNTIVTAFQCGKYQVFGETLDIAIGNMIDTFARNAGLQHPGGPKVEEIAASPGERTFVALPYVVKGMDLSFSGLLTAAMKALDDNELRDVAFSLQENAFAMLAEVTERALAHTKKREVLLTGGVAANGRLQEMVGNIAREHGASFHVVPRGMAGDNGVMIAWNGVLHYRSSGGLPDLDETEVNPRWRLDDVDIPWRK